MGAADTDAHTRAQALHLRNEVLIDRYVVSRIVDLDSDIADVEKGVAADEDSVLPI